MNQILIDLHAHTNASDGSDSPAEVVRKAATLHLSALAITDHDTLGGLAEAEAEAAGLDIELVRGCEISTRSPYNEAHLLGLWLPRDPVRLAPVLAAMALARQRRADRNREIVNKLAALGLPVKYEDVLAVAEGEAVGRPHIAALLCRLGITASPREAFTRFLGSHGQAYVPRQLLEPAEAVDLLVAAGATVSLAHPTLIRCPPEALDRLVASLASRGLTALEAYHSEHSAQDVRFCVELADKYGLLLTGGSDYHGLAKPGVALGRGKGGLRVTKHVLDALKEARVKAGLACEGEG